LLLLLLLLFHLAIRLLTYSPISEISMRGLYVAKYTSAVDANKIIDKFILRK